MNNGESNISDSKDLEKPDYLNPYAQPVPVGIGSHLKDVHIASSEEFPSPGSGKDDENGKPLALQYPGKRPEKSFSVFGGHVSPGEFLASHPVLSVDEVRAEGTPAFYVKVNNENSTSESSSFEFDDELVFNIDDLLSSVEAVPMKDRYPVIAFGSNANPGQLIQKFKDLEGADRNIVTTLHASVKGVVPVYVARIGLNGYVFTDLFPTDDPEAECEVFINFLSRAQLEAMDATEKAYSLCEISDVSIKTSGEDFKTHAYLYVGKVKEGEDGAKGAGVLTDEKGRPIRLAELNANGAKIDDEFGAMTQTEVQRYIYKIAGAHIADAFRLKEYPQNETEIARMIINRTKDERLDDFRQQAKTNARYIKNGKFLLGRAINEAVQEAIRSTGRTTPERSIRGIIQEEMQDISVDRVKTFTELNH